MSRGGQQGAGGGSEEVSRQGPGSQAGHQVCPPRRRHSPELGRRDTTECPWWRVAQPKVMHCNRIMIVTLMLFLLGNNMWMGGHLGKDIRSQETRGQVGKTRGGWRVSVKLPRTGVG